MSDYRVREATLGDVDVLVHHRLAMFAEMRRAFDAPRIDRMFRDWVQPMMTSGEYRSWLCETTSGEVVAGSGLSLIKWPPGPSPGAAVRATAASRSTPRTRRSLCMRHWVIRSRPAR